MNLDLLRTFLVVAETGSLSRAAEAQRVAQSTLTRQMTSLEQEIGGRLLERGPGGVVLTATGHALREQLRPLLPQIDRALAAVRAQAQGRQAMLRVGYLLSAGPRYLHPALARLRRELPEVKVSLLDLSPGEQIAGLRAGTLDVALVGQCGAALRREFYLKRLAELPVLVALAETHPLAARERVELAELKGERFVGAPDVDLPGHNRWVVQLCRRAGFRPRFTEDAGALTHGLALTVSEDAVNLVPEFTRETQVPGVVYRPLVAGPAARWELLVAWQRGRSSQPVKALLAALAGVAGAP